MRSSNDILKEAIVRTLMVAGLVIAFGFIVYQSSVFNPILTSFEFVANGIIIGIAYAAFKSNKPRNGFAALFVWYLLLNGILINPNNSWNYIMSASYIIGLTGAVYLYFFGIRKRFINGRIQRIIASAIIIGVAHGLIVIFLQLFSFRVLAHPTNTLEWSYLNLKTGTLIGILSGVGMEVAEHLIKMFPVQKEVVS